jgi:hypothetical protein
LIGASPTGAAVAAWLCECNTHNVQAGWRFTVADARIKLKRIYLALFDSGHQADYRQIVSPPNWLLPTVS